MSRDTVMELSGELESIYQSGGPQIGVLTVPTLDEQTIEERSIQVFDQWKIGKKGKDKGILILIAKKERKIRIEVGYGLEGDIPDARAKRIVEDLMLPLFRRGDFNSGVIIGIQQIAQLANVDLKNIVPRKQRSDVVWLIFYLPLLFLILILDFLSKRKNGRVMKLRKRFFGDQFGTRHWGGGGGSSWGGGGGGGWGGGWGGGGGSSGGGGASGGW